MFRIEQRRLIAPLFHHRPVTGRLINVCSKIEQDRRLVVAQIWMQILFKVAQFWMLFNNPILD